jgi:sigma-B regulation protein RsbU (phosphoserine phosphatase)
MIVAVGLALVINIILFSRPLRQLQRGTLALAKGQFGHTINLHSKDEWGELAETFNLMSTQLENLYQERAKQERVQRELEIARNVQQALFPPHLPQTDGLEIAAVCQPHRETSGDFYDLIELGNGQIGVVVGDVSGKSIPAAMLMVAAQSTIRAEAHNHASPAEVLNQTNNILHHNIPRGMFAAASYARFDAASQELVWANAGQVYPFLIHRRPQAESKTVLRYLETSGDALPLGIQAAMQYIDHPLKLMPGDTVLFYTDGVVEAMNGDHQLYGFERLEALVAGLEHNVTPQTLIQAVLTDVMAFAGPVEQHDDITLVAIKINRLE